MTQPSDYWAYNISDTLSGYSFYLLKYNWKNKKDYYFRAISEREKHGDFHRLSASTHAELFSTISILSQSGKYIG